MSADTDRLMNNARIHLPGVTDPTLQLELYNVLNDFFQSSNAWQEDIPFGVTPNLANYTIAPSGTSMITRLMYVRNSSKLPISAAMVTPGSVSLRYAPTIADTFTARVSLTIDDPVGSDGFPVFPAWVLAKYNTGILDGLLGRLMAQPAKPYSNAALAAVRTKSFMQTVSEAKTEVLHGNLMNGQSWRFPQTFSSRSQRF